MNEPGAIGAEKQRQARPVFISYASANRKEALSVCKAIERRGTLCWISSRDVAPGENYQEAIVRALRSSRAMVLVFSAAANESEEIKKELSLASRYRNPVLALRIEDVEPSDAFAYELSTRQWIDAFEGRDKAIDALVGRIAQLEDAEPATPAPASRRERRLLPIAAAVGVLLIVLGAAAWWWLRPAPAAAAHSMMVRLAGFETLSQDLPASMRETVDAEIASAFNADGVVGVSSASAPEPGSAPAYALGGTIRRDGDAIRVITRLTNERSGATLWTGTFNYDGNEVAKVPRHIAVDAGNVVRCGLFGASTYHKPLPDPVLKDYMQFCQGHWDPILTEGRKALIPAQRVVAAVPDFAWGWAAVAGGYWKVAGNAETEQLAEKARASGREAADRGIALDPRNSEALYIKSVLLEPHDWTGREDLLKRAVAARRLDCGCEHHQYGWMLLNVGRVTEAIDQLRQANDMLALYVYTPATLADGLLAAGKPEEARQYYAASAALAPNSGFAAGIAGYAAAATGDVKALLDPKLPLPAARRAALLQAYRAVASKDPAAKTAAVRALLALPADQQDEVVARLLAILGASHDAFLMASRIATAGQYPGPSIFWYRDMRATLADPGFPGLANQLGLIAYWKSSHTKPDACSERAPPPLCRMI